MFALEIINALNDPDNPAKVEGLNAKLKRPVHDSFDGIPYYGETEEEASEALDRREEHNISHYASGRFRY